MSVGRNRGLYIVLLCVWAHRCFACMGACVCFLPGIPPVVFTAHLIPTSTKNEWFHRSFYLIKLVLGKAMLFGFRKGSWSYVYFSAQFLKAPARKSGLESQFSTFMKYVFPQTFYFAKILIQKN